MSSNLKSCAHRNLFNLVLINLRLMFHSNALQCKRCIVRRENIPKDLIVDFVFERGALELRKVADSIDIVEQGVFLTEAN